MTTIETGDIITATIYENAAKAVNKLKSNSAETDVKGKIIRAYHATALSSGYNEGKIYSSACDTCNIECNVTCDGCIGCVECEGVQHYSTCYTPPPTPPTPPAS